MAYAKKDYMVFAEHRYGIYVLNSAVLFRMDRETGDVWVFSDAEFHPVQTSKIPLDKIPPKN